MIKRAVTAALAAAAVVLVSAAGTTAQEEQRLKVDSIDAGGHPGVELVVTAPGALSGREIPSKAFTVAEDGVPVDVKVKPLPSNDLAVLLLIDTSGSMQGSAMSAAKSAATDFVRKMPAGVRISVVGFGTSPKVASKFTTDHDQAVAAVGGLDAQGETALYDAVRAASRQFPRNNDVRRALVVLSDGGDTVSQSTLNEAAAVLAAAQASAHVVELKSDESNAEALTAIAKAGGGEVTATADPQALSALYDTVAAQLVNRYVITFASATYGPTKLAVAVNHRGVTAASTRNVQFPAPPPPKPKKTVFALREGEVTTLSWITEPWVPLVGAATVFVGLAVVLLTMLAPRKRKRRLAEDRPATAAEKTPPLVNVTAYLVESAGRTLDRRGNTKTLNAGLERAGMNLRAAEFVVLVGCAAVLTFAVVLLMSGPWVALLFTVIVLVGSRLFLNFKASRREAAFSEQLGDTLQLLAGSLRTGYGLMQAVDAVSREAEEPTGEEFRRLVVETRLGRDFSESLHAMADRIGTDDFTWVVQAMEIHRDVGGDLAEVLDSVAGTIRERDQIRRQVKALSAEGRLSAVILLGLPFFMAFMLNIVQPGYLQELFRSPVGIGMLITSGILMTIGTIWVRRLVRLVF